MSMSPISPRTPKTPVLQPDARARINAELQPGERLLWADQPIPSLYARSGWGIMLFGLVFTGFSAFWILAAGGMLWFSGDSPASNADGVWKIFSCFPLFGLPFLFIGLVMVTSPLWMRRAAARTVYAVTDRRAIACSAKPWGGIEVRSFPPDELESMTRVERSDGAGDLIFREHYTESYNSKGRRSVHHKVLGFLAVDQVRDVENLIRAQLIQPYQARAQSNQQPS